MDAIYARQSVDKKDSISIETQIEFCRRELTSPDDCAVYSDRGYSGSNLQRPEFQRLLSDVEAGKINRIVTYRLDRISRSVLDFANLIDLFDRYGVSFNSTQEKFDTGTPIGKAMLNITMVFAQLERETIAQRIRDNYYSRGEKGMYLGGPAPFGFRKFNQSAERGGVKQLEADPGTSPILERLFRLYGDDGLTLGAIARQLNAEKVPSPNKTVWDSSKISRILRNPIAVRADAGVYRYYLGRGCRFTNEPADFALGKGCYLYGKREGHERKYTDVTGHTLSLAPHDGVIAPDLFLRCQRRLDENKQFGNRRKSRLTWLSGLIKCGKCGYGVLPKSSCGGRYTYLYCTGKSAYSCCDVPGNLGTLETVESAVEELIFQWSDRYSGIKAKIDMPENKERSKMLCRVEEIDLDIRKLVDLTLESNDITASYLNVKISALEAERHNLEEAAEKMSESRPGPPAKGISDIRDEWGNLTVQQKSCIASLLIGRIRLFDHEIEISWNYDFDIGQDYADRMEC